MDKFLWIVRIHKTRRLATEACQAQRVKVNGVLAKASRMVRKGDVLETRLPDITRTVKILDLRERRLPAKEVPGALEDLTPESEYQRQRELRESSVATRLRGTGRPTKKDRREMERFWES